jgi:hypothetical protein
MEANVPIDTLREDRLKGVPAGTLDHVDEGSGVENDL